MNFLKRLFLAIFRKDKSKEKKISIKLNRKKITSKSDAENLQNIEFAKTEYSTPKENEKNKAFIIREESNSYKPIQSVISDFPSKKLSPIKILDFKSPNEIHKNILGINFIFCKEGYKMFKEEFSSSEMDVEYDDFNCYLVKKIGKKYLSFHRWLMDTLGKIDEEAFKRGCSTKQLVVHHINHNHQDNRIKNLVVVGKEEHKIYHGKEKMYKNGNWKDRNSFEEWYSNHFKNSIEPTMLTFVNKFNKNN